MKKPLVSLLILSTIFHSTFVLADEAFTVTETQIEEIKGPEIIREAEEIIETGVITQTEETEFVELQEEETFVSYANPHAATSVSSITFTYDRNGNTLYDINTTNTWNYRNELKQAIQGGVDTYTYIYDQNGDRMSVDDGSSTSYYPNKYYNEIDSEITKNIYLKDTLVGTVEGSGGSAEYHWNHTDHLTGSNVTTDDTGALEQTLDYFPYGEVRLNDQVTSFDQNRKYAGSVADDTGLNYLGARYQDGQASRFISQDPVFRDLGTDLSKYGTDTEKLLSNPQILNSYSYATNNPIKYNDPDGEIIDTVLDYGVSHHL